MTKWVISLTYVGEWNIPQGTKERLNKEAERAHPLIFQEIILSDMYASVWQGFIAEKELVNGGKLISSHI